MARILVVEDEAIRTTIAYNLKRRARPTVADGEAAIAQANADPPDLVILDIVLPTIDGFDVCRHPPFSSVPILMLTARDDESTASSA